MHKILNTLADPFRLAHWGLLKLKKYEAWVYNEDQTITEINEKADSTSDLKVNNQSKMSEKDQQNTNTINYTFGGDYWKYGKFGHSMKECQSNSIMANQDQAYKGQTFTQTEEPIRYPTPITPVRPLVLTQQITTDFQLF